VTLVILAAVAAEVVARRWRPAEEVGLIGSEERQPVER
jgi:hypothetical protein